MNWILGQEAIHSKYGVGRITEIGPVNRTRITNDPEWIGFTPYVAKYQMNFAPHNLSVIPIYQGK